MRRLILSGVLLLPLSAIAAINPAEFTRHAPYQLQLRPIAQIVDHFERDGDAWRRTTIVAEVVAEHRDTDDIAVGDTVVIDWTVNLDAQQRESTEYAERMASMSGPQFMHAPNPPAPDADGLIWAHLQDDATASATLPPAATDPKTTHEADRRIGRILAPAASQYSFDRPDDADTSEAEPPLQTVAELLAGDRSGLVRVRGCLQVNFVDAVYLFPDCDADFDDLSLPVDLAVVAKPPLGLQAEQWRCVTVVGDWDSYADGDIAIGWSSKNGVIDHASVALSEGCKARMRQ
jgi:hypothetical protein